MTATLTDRAPVEAVRKAIADAVATNGKMPGRRTLAADLGLTEYQVRKAMDQLSIQSGLPAPELPVPPVVDDPVGEPASAMGDDDARVGEVGDQAGEDGRPPADSDRPAPGDDQAAAQDHRPAGEVHEPVGNGARPAADQVGDGGSTKVERRRRQVAERTELVALDVQDADLTMTVRRRRIDTAAAEHTLRQLPNYRAYLARRIRVISAVIGAVLMIGMGAWSAVGVHHAIAADAPRWSSAWIAGWVLEPVLLTGVALIILARSMIALAGGRLHGGVWAIELAILALSVAANLKALPESPSLADVVIRLTAPLFCVLISIVLGAIDVALDQIRPVPGVIHQ